MEYLLKIHYSWGDEEPDMQFATREEAWSKAKEMAMEEVQTVCAEHECEVGLFVDEQECKIQLHYTYDDEYCYYIVEEK